MKRRRILFSYLWLKWSDNRRKCEETWYFMKHHTLGLATKGRCLCGIRRRVFTKYVYKLKARHLWQLKKQQHPKYLKSYKTALSHFSRFSERLSSTPTSVFSPSLSAAVLSLANRLYTNPHKWILIKCREASISCQGNRLVLLRCWGHLIEQKWLPNSLVWFSFNLCWFDFTTASCLLLLFYQELSLCLSLFISILVPYSKLRSVFFF